MPKAMYFIMTISENPKAPVTTIMIAAAAVIMRPVEAVPKRMDSWVVWPAACASTMRETRKIS